MIFSTFDRIFAHHFIVQYYFRVWFLNLKTRKIKDSKEKIKRIYICQTISLYFIELTTMIFPQDPNQLIRACALRVLSSIRVPVIVPIMMLAIKDAVSDMSPYVRKTAAHAIPKLYK